MALSLADYDLGEEEYAIVRPDPQYCAKFKKCMVCVARGLLPSQAMSNKCAKLSSGEVDFLPSWNDGAVKQAILAFVRGVSTPGPKFVEPAERVAVFDNDGTLGAEQPIYVQLAFASDRARQIAAENPNRRDDPDLGALLEGEFAATLAAGLRAVVERPLLAFVGLTTDEYAQLVLAWLAETKHPTKHVPYTQLVYQPMLELLAHLRAHEFETFIVSGGGVEFMAITAKASASWAPARRGRAWPSRRRARSPSMTR